MPHAKKMKFCQLLLMLLTLYGCDTSTEQKRFEDYGDIYIKNDNSFVVLQRNHPTGWQHEQCMSCHVLDRIHRFDRIADIAVDFLGIEQKIMQDGLRSCTECHGRNGI